MLGLFDSRAREIRHLNRDAPLVIENARESYRSELVRDIAVLSHQKIREAETHCAEDTACLKRALDHFRKLHREARRRSEHVALTAYTLVIIYLRAHIIGHDCAPARAAIDGFLNDWRHAFGEDDGEPGESP